MAEYLVCILDDINYADADIFVCSSLSKAIETCHDTMKRFKCEFTDVEEIDDGKWRLECIVGSGFVVYEIFKIDPSKGDYMLIWHHAYNGVDFKILLQGTNEECTNRRIKELNDAFSDYNKEPDEGNWIDVGDEWEVYDIVNIKEIEI